VSFPVLVYILCAAMSLLCTGLLLRAYMRNKTKLLFWCAIGFAGLALENVVLFIDLVVLPTTDLSLIRHGAALMSLLCMLYGLIWDVR
jgi:hypothetical protein